MSNLTPREVLAEADRYRRTAEMAESAQRKIRLNQTPVMRGGLLRFRKQHPSDVETFFSLSETSAIYEALSDVRREALAAAERIEAKLQVANEATS